jgi:hypothetical protein
MDVVSFAWSRAVSVHVAAWKLTVISHVPFPYCRSGVIVLAFAGNPKNDGHPSPWQEAVGQDYPGLDPRHTQERRREQGNDCIMLGLFVMLFQDVVFGWPEREGASCRL